MDTILAPAKLTLSLKITGVRPDGFHLLAAEMVTVDLCDELTISPGPRVVDLVGPHANVVDPKSNSILDALELVNATRSVRLTKNIPAQAGLGGGSADAAAILRWAGFKDLRTAAKLGADVPFCVVGGQANVTGIGEIVDPVELTPANFTLYCPNIACSTPAVYQHWDKLGGPSGQNGNDLEPAVLDLFPEMQQAKEYLGNLTGLSPRLAGSGSTWFVEGHHEQADLILCSSVKL